MTEDAAGAVLGHLHFHERLALHSGDPVVPREPLVHEGVIRADEIEHAAVFAHDRLEKHFRLAFHRRAQRPVPIREGFCVRLHDFQIAQLQPLTGEVFHQLAGLRIGQHAPHLRGQIFAQSPALRLGVEGVVGHRAPQEIGQARGQRPLADGSRGLGVIRLGLQLAAEKKMRRDKDRGQRGLHRLFEVRALFLRLLTDPEKALDLRRGERTAEGALAKAGEDGACGFLQRRLPATRREDAELRSGRFHRLRRGGENDLPHREDAAHRAALLLLRLGQRIRHAQGQRIRAGFLHPHRRGERFLRILAPGEVSRPQRLAIEFPLQLRRLRADLHGFERQLELILAGHRQLDRHAGFVFVDLPRLRGGARLPPARDFEKIDLDLLRARLVVVEDRQADDLFRCREVALEKHRRQREHVADVVEAVAGIVRREIVCRTEVHADEIADGVVVFRAVEAADGHAARIGPGRIDGENRTIDPRHDFLPLVERRLLLIVRRHLPGAQCFEDVLPRFLILHHRVGRRPLVQGQPALLLPVAVALEAVRFHHRPHVFRKVRRGRGGRARGHAGKQQRGAERQADGGAQEHGGKG